MQDRERPHAPGGAAPGDETEPGTTQSAPNLCPECGGTGVADGETCPVCAGGGTITAIVGDA